MSKYVVPGTILLVALLFATLGLFVYQNHRTIKNLSEKTAAQTPVPISISSSPSQSPLAKQTKKATETAIETNINSKSFTALEKYMTEKVIVTLMSTDCCGEVTKEEATEQLNYILEGIPLNFNQLDENIANLKNKNQQLTNKFMGISENNEHLAGFALNSENQINAIQLSVSWQLYDQ